MTKNSEAKFGDRFHMCLKKFFHHDKVTPKNNNKRVKEQNEKKVVGRFICKNCILKTWKYPAYV